MSKSCPSASKWVKSRFPGVRFRLHPERRHGNGPDKYIVLTYKKDGKTISESLGWMSATGINEADANELLVNLRRNKRLAEGPASLSEKRKVEAAKQEEAKRTGLTLIDFWESDYLRHVKARIKENSWTKEVQHYNDWLKDELGQKPMRDLTQNDLEKFKDKLVVANLAPRTIQYILGTFRRIWKHAARRGIVQVQNNPVTGIPTPLPPNNRLRALTPAECRQILANLKETDIHGHDMTLFAMLTGCRASEAFRLTWGRVDMNRRVALLADTKNSDSREVFLAPEVVDMLQRRGPGRLNDPVFTDSRGKPYREAPYTFRAVVNELGLNEGREVRERITFHTLRHTAATYAARRGVPVKDLQEMFGWKTPAMVFRYAKGDESVQRAAIAGIGQELLNEDHGKVIPLNRKAA